MKKKISVAAMSAEAHVELQEAINKALVDGGILDTDGKLLNANGMVAAAVRGNYELKDDPPPAPDLTTCHMEMALSSALCGRGESEPRVYLYIEYDRKVSFMQSLRQSVNQTVGLTVRMIVRDIVFTGAWPTSSISLTVQHPAPNKSIDQINLDKIQLQVTPDDLAEQLRHAVFIMLCKFKSSEYVTEIYKLHVASDLAQRFGNDVAPNQASVQPQLVTAAVSKPSKTLLLAMKQFVADVNNDDYNLLTDLLEEHTSEQLLAAMRALKHN